MAAINYSFVPDSDTTSLEGLTMGNIYPNPSHIGMSYIPVNIPDDEEYNEGVDYSLLIYNILGKRVATVKRDFNCPDNTYPYCFPWNHRNDNNDNGELAASGIYFAVLNVRGNIISRKFVVLH